MKTAFNVNRNPTTAICLILGVLIVPTGCQTQAPAGGVVQPHPLGTIVDELNWLQEENAELAKFIIYNHEFEINLQDAIEGPQTGTPMQSSFEYKPINRIRGNRLTPAGEAHVRQIAVQLSTSAADPRHFVVVEKSNTSKSWETQHHYPVHQNDELDLIRRQVVVSSLVAMGIPYADEIVIVAPAYPSGLGAEEASAAHQRATGNFGPTNNNFFGR